MIKRMRCVCLRKRHTSTELLRRRIGVETIGGVMIRCRHVTCATQVANWVKTCSRLTVDAKEDLSECCESATADMPKVRVLRVCDC